MTLGRQRRGQGLNRGGLMNVSGQANVGRAAVASLPELVALGLSWQARPEQYDDGIDAAG